MNHSIKTLTLFFVLLSFSYPSFSDEDQDRFLRNSAAETFSGYYRLRFQHEELKPELADQVRTAEVPNLKLLEIFMNQSFPLEIREAALLAIAEPRLDKLPDIMTHLIEIAEGRRGPIPDVLSSYLPGVILKLVNFPLAEGDELPKQERILGQVLDYISKFTDNEKFSELLKIVARRPFSQPLADFASNQLQNGNQERRIAVAENISLIVSDPQKLVEVMGPELTKQSKAVQIKLIASLGNLMRAGFSYSMMSSQAEITDLNSRLTDIANSQERTVLHDFLLRLHLSSSDGDIRATAYRTLLVLHGWLDPENRDLVIDTFETRPWHDQRGLQQQINEAAQEIVDAKIFEKEKKLSHMLCIKFI